MNNPYDEFPYRSAPVPWSAPEWLALASLLHGGPRPALHGYRALELGCGDGSNLLPLAYYRTHASFLGVDGSAAAITRAEARRQELGLENARFLHADFEQAEQLLDGPFDFIISHGVFSWIPDGARDCLLRLCARNLRSSGLLYLNYNTLPGWHVRGLVRSFVRERAGQRHGLVAQASEAQSFAAQLSAALGSAGEHPFLKLMQREFQFVQDGDPSYVAHEFLAPDNRAYWRREFLELARSHGFAHVADADFNRDSGRVSASLQAELAKSELAGARADDLLDLVIYRQLHSPILALSGFTRAPATSRELDALYLAASFTRSEREPDNEHMLRHESGFEVELREPAIQRALNALSAIWPRGRSIASLFGADSPHIADLLLMHGHGLVELRLDEPDPDDPAPERLNNSERAWSGYATTPYHFPYRA